MSKERRLWNQLKIQALRLLEKNAGLTSHDVSNALIVSVPDAGMLLNRLHRQKLVERKTPDVWRLFKKPPFCYSIQQRGVERLRYLQSEMHGCQEACGQDDS